MKRILTLCAISVGLAAPALAIDLNTDAMKSMQKEGHKIVAEAQGERAFKASNGQCLMAKGGGLALAKCDAKSKPQTWRFDAESRLVAHDGRCIDGAQLKKCGKAKSQRWTEDARNRLTNQAKKCLQPEGKPPKKGARVIIANCSKAAEQSWK